MIAFAFFGKSASAFWERERKRDCGFLNNVSSLGVELEIKMYEDCRTAISSYHAGKEDGLAEIILFFDVCNHQISFNTYLIFAGFHPGYVTVLVTLVCGVAGLAMGLLSRTAESAASITSAVRRLRLFTGIYMFILGVTLLVALVILGWELWFMINFRSGKGETEHFPFEGAMTIVVCCMNTVMSIVPMFALYESLRPLSGAEIVVAE